MKHIKPTYHFCFLCIIIVVLLNYNCSLAQNFSFKTKRQQQSISFQLIKNLIVIPIYINGEGPFDFILDTGVGPMLVLDPKLKESLKVAHARPIKISGYGNFEGIDALLTATSASIGDADIASIPTIFLKDDISMLSGYLGKKIYGLIGYHFFNSFIVNVNYSTQKVKFSLASKKQRFRGEKVPIEIIENKPYLQLQLTQENIGTVNLKTLIDCGASHSLSLEAYHQLPFPQPKNTIEANLGTGLTGEITGKIARVSDVQIGSFSLKNVLASYPIYNIDTAKATTRNANLGAEIISRFHITYDFAKGFIYLRKNSRYIAPFEHDMTGIELYKEPGPYAKSVIAKVEANSPAQLAGLTEGDEVIGLNFKDINDYSLNEITAIFKGKSGNTIAIEVFRKTTNLMKLLKLKKRI